jgi:DNA-binding NarL/FixJ family response regulator
MTEAGTTRIVLVDDHAIVREGLRALFEDVPGLELVGEAANGNEALALVRRTRPHVVLIDLKMPGIPAEDAIRSIRAEHVATQVLVLSSLAEADRVQSSLAAGALGYVLKEATKSELVAAIQAVATGRTWLHTLAQQALANKMRKPAPIDPFAGLTEREQSILRLIAQGRSNKEIARTLHLTEGTVKGYVSNVLAKLRLEDRTQAALFAVKNGLESA